MNEFILLENRKSEGAASSMLFTNYQAEVHCLQPEKLSENFAKLADLQRQGFYLVGYVSYEAAYALDDIIHLPIEHDFPLLHFMAFKHCQKLTQPEVADYLQKQIAHPEQEAFLYDIQFGFAKENYFPKIDQIKEHIRNGDTYQVNFTGKYNFKTQGNPIKLYQHLRERQPVEYSALFHLQNHQILSLSPELFFKKTGDSMLTKPMKGTMPRSSCAQADRANKEFLTNDPKQIAENVIIVDLVRNDMSRIALPGSVTVPKLFQVESFKTVHQMVSFIEAKVDPAISFETIIRGIFPCGSITGAPKRRTMQIIHELEAAPRKVYTGAIGYITPENDMCFNVPIRTLLLKNNRGELGVGGGIVHDSYAEDEYKEAKLKAKFITGVGVDFNLIECFLYNQNYGFRYLSEHLDRLQHSAKIFGFKCHAEKIISELNQLQLPSNQDYKIRIELDYSGEFAISYQPIKVRLNPDPLKIRIYEATPIDQQNILFQHKTTAKSVRGFYQKVYDDLVKFDDIYDAIFVNQKGQITEGSKTNIYIENEQGIFTPPVESGALPGIFRKITLQKNPRIQIAPITVDQLQNAKAIYISNSIISWQTAKLVL